MFRIVKINSGLFVSRVFQVWSEQPQVLVFLSLVLLLGVVEVTLLFSYLGFDDRLVLELQVIKHTSSDMVAQVLKSFGTHAELTNAVNLEGV